MPFLLLSCCRLRQVVAERCEEHIVDGVRCDPAGAGPGIAFQPAVLEALAKASVLAAVEVIPIANRNFLYILVVDAAVCWRSRGETVRRAGGNGGRRSTRQRLGVATGGRGVVDAITCLSAAFEVNAATDI